MELMRASFEFSNGFEGGVFASCSDVDCSEAANLRRNQDPRVQFLSKLCFMNNYSQVKRAHLITNLLDDLKSDKLLCTKERFHTFGVHH